ncbi:MAG TPA: site-specific DNA-methyltransferase [Spirochaetota bacterium]|nr:site-specific DNA-methyltransferase [Spirochaetota bacterium]
MAIKYVPFIPETVSGQAILDNFIRTRRILKYKDNEKVYGRLNRGLPLYELEKIERVGDNPKNRVIRGECLSACAYLRDKNIKVDLVYIDPPFASGADYAKKVYIRRNPELAKKIEKTEESMDIEELRSFEEKMYGDIWNKEDYLNWMYENLVAIKSIMSDTGSIYVHLDWHIGHYVKILMDEVFGEDNFKNEIIWKYFGPTSTKINYPKKHDNIYFYTKSDNYFFNYEACLVPYDEKAINRYDKVDENGKKYKLYNEKDGTVRKAYMNDGTPSEIFEIPFVQGIELIDIEYSTRKPEKLLEIFIKASSNEGMLIADFFGGSGVTAKVANDLNRNFIHVDIGINSIQTTRDRLIQSKAEFDIYEIKDGVSLFRNSVQTMDKLKSMITGLKNEDSLDSFWEGIINDSKLGMIPVYIPNLLDHTTKLLDIPLMNRVLNIALPELEDNIKKVIVYYIDIDEENELKKFIDDNNPTEIEVELRDLKEILQEVVVNDIINYEIKNDGKNHIIEFKSFISDRLIQKIDEYNNKKGLQNSKETLFDEENSNNDTEEENGNDNKNKKFKPIEISENGLELIELISIDFTNKDGLWISGYELKIDKKGYVILNGEKTKNFWDGKVIVDKKPLRMKVRNIAGDERVVEM